MLPYFLAGDLKMDAEAVEVNAPGRVAPPAPGIAGVPAGPPAPGDAPAPAEPPAPGNAQAQVEPPAQVVAPAEPEEKAEGEQGNKILRKVKALRTFKMPWTVF